ncbi:MAG: zinc-binding dehydrogenase [Acidobacteriia bacterium]|nr:zinc-binding dehydrogenase [Terriglobia bacterium]
MRAIRIHKHGGPGEIRIDDIPVPIIKPHEALLEVKSTSLNHLDLWVRNGMPGVQLPLPLILGSDASGVVKGIGATVKNIKVGDRVLVVPGYGCGECEECFSGRENYCLEYAIYGEHGDGIQMENLAVDSRRLLVMPPNISFDEGAAIPLVYLTAWEMLVNKAGVQPWHTVLVWSASSGVGSAAVQIAKLYGARVVTTAGGPEKVAKAQQLLNPDLVIDYRTQDVVKEIRSLTRGHGADIVVDHVGQATWEKSLRSLAKGGRLVFCGATTGPQVSFDQRFLFFKQQSILGSTMGDRGDLFKVLQLVERGKLKAVVDRAFDAEAIREAHEYLETGKQFGKVIVRFAR